MVKNPEVCTDYGDYTICSSQKYEENVTESKSGNVSYEANGRACYSVEFETTPEFNYSECYKFHYHALIKDGELHEDGESVRGSYTTASGEECKVSFKVHYANGKLQFYDYTDSCFP